MGNLFVRTGNNTLRRARPEHYIRKVLKAGDIYETTGNLEPLSEAVHAAEKYLEGIIQPDNEIHPGLHGVSRTGHTQRQPKRL